MKNEKVTIDELLEKIPNKYELVIACEKLARSKEFENIEKHKVMDKVFKEIMDDQIKLTNSI